MAACFLGVNFLADGKSKEKKMKTSDQITEIKLHVSLSILHSLSSLVV